jgi:hypothetical protein
MYKPMLAVACALMMTACASTTPPIGENSPPRIRQRPVQADLEECQAPPEAKDGSRAEVLANHVLVAKAYYDCQERHRALSEWVKRNEP